MSNLISMGRGIDSQVKGNLNYLSDMENKREVANKQLDQQYKAQKSTNVATGAGLGWMAGAKIGSVGGPIGAVAGAAIGYLATELF